MRTLTLFLSALTLSCTGEKVDDTGDSGSTGMTIDCATDAWDIGADADWKGTWMSQCFVPDMKAILVGIDADRFANASCANCHGADVGGGTYAMPAATELSWSTADTWDTAFYDPTTYTGPMNDMVATGAALLGQDPYDAETNPSGFGCASCHLFVE